jgi:hypothetical protein
MKIRTDRLGARSAPEDTGKRPRVACGVTADHGSLRRARRIARVLLLGGALTPAMLSAQGPTTSRTPTETEEHIDGPSYGRVALVFTQVYDDNIFAVPLSQHPQSDLVSRFGPTFEVGRHSRRLEMSAKYGMAAERYVDRVDLNSDVAYQNGGFDVRYNATPRTALRVSGAYVDTQSPQELNQATLLTTGRARAERLQAHIGSTHDLTMLTQLNLDYDVSNDTLQETNTNLSHLARIGFAWRSSGRSSYRVDYRPRYVKFNVLQQDVTGRQFRDIGNETTQLLTAGWVYAVTPLTSIEIDGGPRLTAGEFKPEFSGLVRRRMQKGAEISASYQSTQDTAFGEAGFIDVQRVTVLMSVTPLRRLTMSATPAWARSTLRDQTTEVRELDVNIVLRVLRRLSFTAAARVADQDGRFNGTRDPIQSRRLWLTSTLTLP